MERAIQLAFLVMGLVFAAFGVFLLRQATQRWHDQQRFRANAAFTQGTVIRLKESGRYRSPSKRTYFPVVQFQAGGRTCEFTASIGSNPPSYRQAEIVPVIYNPEDPTKADIDSWQSRWLGVMVFSLVGGAFTLIGVFAPIFFWRSTRRAP